MASPTPPYAVLTGDLIKSSSLSAAELGQARDLVLATFRDLAAWDSTKEVVVGEAEFFRGDSWQAALSQPQFALRAILLLRARLRHQALTDTRIALGLGAVAALDPKRISLSSGEAFLLSGGALDALSKQVELAVALPQTADPTLAAWLPVVLRLCGSLVGGWTSRQAEIVSLAIHPQKPTQQQIADRLQVSRPTVTVALETAHWATLEETMETFETQIITFAHSQ